MTDKGEFEVQETLDKVPLEVAEEIETVEKKESLDLLPQSVVEELKKTFACDEEVLRSILKSVDGDFDRALHMIKELAPTFIAMKLAFSSRGRDDFGGAMCLVANGVSGEILDKVYWVGHKSGLMSSLDVTVGWEAVRRSIATFSGRMEQTFFKQFKMLFEEIFSPTVINGMFSSSERVFDVKKRIAKNIGDTFHHDFILYFSVERFNKARLVASGIVAAEQKKDSSEDHDTSVSASIREVTLSCRPVVDPVQGKPVSELKNGVLLYVKIDDAPGIPRMINKLLEKNSEQPVFPVSMVQNLPSGQVLVLLDISDGIKGLLKLPGDIKLKCVNFSPALELNRLGAGFGGKSFLVGLFLFLFMLLVFLIKF